MDTVYTFGPFRLDISSEILFRGADPVPVGRRAVGVLRALVEHLGAPVSKDALMQAAWPGLAVEEVMRRRRFLDLLGDTRSALTETDRCRESDFFTLHDLAEARLGKN